MKAYKCDICGALYDKINSISIKAKCNRKCYIFEEYDKYDKNKVCCIDACPDCISAIQKVIDERSEK